MSNQHLAIVTGAAHRVGKIFAQTLARQGYAILLHYHRSSEEEAKAAAEELRTEGAPVYLHRANLMHATEIEALFRYVDTLPHRLKILVNSSAVMERHDIRTMSGAEWDTVMALNLRAPFLCAQQAAKRMSHGGLIINVSDIAAQKAWTAFPAYSVSKAGLDSLTHILARALAPHIRVNAIAPGFALRNQELPEDEWERLISRVPLKRTSEESEIASALEFLLKNEYITGQVVTIDGGYSLI
jgi:pteridine reductase